MQKQPFNSQTVPTVLPGSFNTSMANSIFTDGQLSDFLRPFFSLQNPTATPLKTDSFHDSQYYLTDSNDIFLIITCIAVMAILRDGLRLLVLEPYARWKLTREMEQKIAKQLKSSNGRLPNGRANGNAKLDTGGKGVQDGYGDGNGVLNVNGVHHQMTRREQREMRHKVLRFAEQGWSFVYYAVQWVYGLYVYSRLPTRVFDPVDLWINYPHIPLAGPVKFYYLTQLAFYIHQVLILNAEARRKDYHQMMAHHVITITLVGASYLMNFTRVGCLIMVLMDCSDIYLPLAKMLRYLSYRKLCDATFTVFLVSWFITRHVFFIFVIKSVYSDSLNLVKYTDWVPEKGRYLSQVTCNVFVALLVSLEVIQAVWFWMICRVAWRVISGQGADDERSDDEAETENEEKKNQ